VDPLIGLRTLAAPPAGLLRVATDHSASTLTPGDRARLLADLRSNKGPTRILVEATVFEQGGGHNRNYVRFRPGVLRHLAASFRGVPFLRDHAQQDLAARGGTVLDSHFEPGADQGHGRIRQTIELVKPWAIEAALDGTLDRFSIGWHNTRPPVCSACGAPFALFGGGGGCDHLPGDEIASADGARRRVEILMTGADGVETSAVSVPAVAGTGVDGIRAALAAARSTARRQIMAQMDPALAVGTRVVATVDREPIMTGMAGEVLEATAGEPPTYSVQFDDLADPQTVSEAEIGPEEGAAAAPDPVGELARSLGLAASATSRAMAGAARKLSADLADARMLHASEAKAREAAEARAVKAETEIAGLRQTAHGAAVDRLLEAVRAKVGQKLGADGKPVRGGTEDEAYVLEVAEHDLARAQRIVSKMPSRLVRGGISEGTAPPRAAGSLTEGQRRINRQLGISDADYLKRNREDEV
jgi:hypothetical protein